RLHGLLKRRTTLPDPQGLHARPEGHLLQPDLRRHDLQRRQEPVAREGPRRRLDGAVSARAHRRVPAGRLRSLRAFPHARDAAGGEPRAPPQEPRDGREPVAHAGARGRDCAHARAPAGGDHARPAGEDRRDPLDRPGSVQAAARDQQGRRGRRLSRPGSGRRARRARTDRRSESDDVRRAADHRRQPRHPGRGESHRPADDRARSRRRAVAVVAVPFEQRRREGRRSHRLVRSRWTVSGGLSGRRDLRNPQQPRRAFRRSARLSDGEAQPRPAGAADLGRASRRHRRGNRARARSHQGAQAMRRRVLALPILLLAAIALQLVHLPDAIAPARPLLVPMVFAYWTYISPAGPSILLAWLVGLVLDVLLNAPLGEHALALLVGIYMVYRMRRIMLMVAFWQTALVLALPLGLYTVVLFYIDGVRGQQADLWTRWLPIASSVILWPFLFPVLSMLGKPSRD